MRENDKELEGMELSEVDQYRKLRDKLWEDRDAAKEAVFVPSALELATLAKMEKLWYGLSQEEQDALEAEGANR